MTTFLGVPIRTRNAVLGSLYLADRLDGASVADEDEELMLALAASAGAAIDDARRDEGRRPGSGGCRRRARSIGPCWRRT